jgi:hypothetical protein
VAVTPPVPPIPAPGAPALQVTLPGGLVVEGVAQQIGADALTQARALIGAANAALAPLGPVFRIIDAVLAVKGFAEAVPELIVNPGAVVEAVVELVAKIGRLASLVPQLSVPLMVLGLVDAVITLLQGVQAELVVIEQQVARVEATRTSAAALPPDAQAALLAIADAATAQVEVRRADLATALGSVQPVLGILNVFAGMAGLPALEVSGGASSEALGTAVEALQAFRSTIPV